ncbi:hypothetical protein D3C76_1837990 [compost metagenome]
MFGSDLLNRRDVRNFVARQRCEGGQGQVVLAGVVQQGVLSEQYVVFDLNG